MFVRNMDWPKDCGEKIGIRLEVVTIPVVKYINITQQANEDPELNIDINNENVNEVIQKQEEAAILKQESATAKGSSKNE